MLHASNIMGSACALGLLFLVSAGCGGATVASTDQSKDAGARPADAATKPDAHGSVGDARPRGFDAAGDVGSPAVDAQGHDAAALDAPAVADAADAADSASDASLPLSAPCHGMAGLTGQALLDALHPEYTATYTPVGNGSPTTLTIGTSYAGGRVSCHTTCDECQPGGVVVVMDISFVTADGTFSEHFTTPVELAPGGNTLSWDPVVPASSIHGTYKPSLGGASVNLSFGGSFNGTTTGGNVVQQRPGMVAGAGGWM